MGDLHTHNFLLHHVMFYFSSITHIVNSYKQV